MGEWSCQGVPALAGMPEPTAVHRFWVKHTDVAWVYVRSSTQRIVHPPSAAHGLPRYAPIFSDSTMQMLSADAIAINVCEGIWGERRTQSVVAWAMRTRFARKDAASAASQPKFDAARWGQLCRQLSRVDRCFHFAEVQDMVTEHLHSSVKGATLAVNVKSMLDSPAICPFLADIPDIRLDDISGLEDGQECRPVRLLTVALSWAALAVGEKIMPTRFRRMSFADAQAWFFLLCDDIHVDEAVALSAQLREVFSNIAA